MERAGVETIGFWGDVFWWVIVAAVAAQVMVWAARAIREGVKRDEWSDDGDDWWNR
jgi:hypothetical protein